MIFHKVKCKVLLLDQENPQQQCRLAEEIIESSLAKKKIDVGG